MSRSRRVEAVRRRVLADREMFGRFERAVRRKGWAAATVDHGIGHGSLKNTFVHILNVQEAWLVAISQERPEIFRRKGRRPNALGSWAELARYRDLVWAEVDELLGSLDERTLDRRVRAPWMPGRYTIEDAFAQASYEQAHHLGEVIAVFWQAGGRPPKMTWIENAELRAPRTGA
jgi:uncharacterized damage-inducible protein DinB